MIYYWLIDDDIYFFLPTLNGNSFDIRSENWFVPEIIALQFKYIFRYVFLFTFILCVCVSVYMWKIE